MTIIVYSLLRQTSDCKRCPLVALLAPPSHLEHVVVVPIAHATVCALLCCARRRVELEDVLDLHLAHVVDDVFVVIQNAVRTLLACVLVDARAEAYPNAIGQHRHAVGVGPDAAHSLNDKPQSR